MEGKWVIGDIIDIINELKQQILSNLAPLLDFSVKEVNMLSLSFRPVGDFKVPANKIILTDTKENIYILLDNDCRKNLLYKNLSFLNLRKSLKSIIQQIHRSRDFLKLIKISGNCL